jgi:hypothetical protein
MTYTKVKIVFINVNIPTMSAQKKLTHKGKAIFVSLAVIFIQMIVSNLLYMNPVAAKINQQFKGYHSIKTFDFIGGLTNWIIITMIFSLLYMFFLIVIFIYIFPVIPGKGWKKGFLFGLTFGMVKAIPEAFNQWMVIDYPYQLILLQLVNTILGLLLFGFLLGYAFTKYKIIAKDELEFLYF